MPQNTRYMFGRKVVGTFHLSGRGDWRWNANVRGFESCAEPNVFVLAKGREDQTILFQRFLALSYFWDVQPQVQYLIWSKI